MTYISNDLNRICRDWCPMVEICEVEHLCESMKKIRKLIIKISELDDYGKE